MLYFDRINVSEGINILFFLDEGFKFQPNVYNKCHDLLMMSMNLSDFAILKIIAVLLMELGKVRA